MDGGLGIYNPIPSVLILFAFWRERREGIKMSEYIQKDFPVLIS